MASIVQQVREACSSPATVAKAREAFALLHAYSDNAPRLPGCGTVERMAVRIHSGWSVEQTAAREYAYRWHLPLGQWVNHAESRSRSRQCCGEWPVPHLIGM